MLHSTAKAHILLVACVCLLLSLVRSDDGLCTAPPPGEAPDPSSCGGIDGLEDVGLEYIDITVELKEGLPVWDSETGLPKGFTSLFFDMDKGDDCYLTQLNEFIAHTGTHLDMPSHFLKEEYKSGNTVEKLDLSIIIGPALIVQIPEGDNITAAVLEKLNLPMDFERLIFRTDSSDKKLLSKSAFVASYTALTPDGARWLVNERPNIKMLGIDYVSIANYADVAEGHQVLFRKGIIPVEGLLLVDVAPGWYDLTCLPLKLTGAEGAPCRCILMNHSPVDEGVDYGGDDDDDEYGHGDDGMEYGPDAGMYYDDGHGDGGGDAGYEDY